MTLSLILALTFLAATSAHVEAQSSGSRELRSAVWRRSLSEALRISGDLAEPTAEDAYLIGLALVYLHDPLLASAHLRAARAEGFRPRRGWPDVDQLLERGETCRRLEPSLRCPSPTVADPSITVYAGPTTPWSGPVLDAIPEFEEVSRSIFGKDVPPMRFYLFADRGEYDRFFEALFGMPVQTSWQDGTGTYNVVVYCEKDREGKEGRKAGAPDTIGAVFHEFGHAWIGTYLMYRHGREWLGPGMRRPWLDEGLSDFIASLRDPALIHRRERWLRQAAARGTPPPTLERIQSFDGFYKHDDVDVHYWISAVFVASLLEPRECAPETIRGFLDEAGRSGSVEEALSAVTGLELSAEFDRVVRRFW